MKDFHPKSLFFQFSVQTKALYAGEQRRGEVGEEGRN